MMHGAKKIPLEEMPVEVDRPTERTHNHDRADKAILDAMARKTREFKARAEAKKNGERR